MKSLVVFCSIILIGTSSVLSQTWERSLNGRSVWSLARDAQNNVYAGGLTGANSRIWKSTNNGTTWDTIYFGSGQTMWDFAFDQQGNMYVANYSAGLLKSTNYGANFTIIPSSVFNNKNLQGVECGNDGYIYVNTSSGFFRSTDYGQTFTETALTGLICLPVLVDKDSSNIVYVGVSGGSGIGFYRSTDYGLTFSSNLNPGKNGYNLYQKENGDLYMISTTSPYNFDISTNRGLSWTTASNLPSAQRGVTYSDSNFIYTSGNGGVFKSTDNGSTFSNVNFTITATPILYQKYFNVPTIYAGVSGAANGGVWRYIEGTSGLVPRISLKVLLEGSYDPNANQMVRRDTIRAFLAMSSFPYFYLDSARGVFDPQTFETMVFFPKSTSGIYYIVVMHMNSMETWSKIGGESITAGVTYNCDFTLADSQAYGSNQQQVDNSPVRYAIFSGDVNQDRYVDLGDIISVFNDAGSFQSGYVPTDVNGDYFVDLSDLTITFNNAASFVMVSKP